jgi:hypothetical protein
MEVSLPLCVKSQDKYLPGTYPYLGSALIMHG